MYSYDFEWLTSNLTLDYPFTDRVVMGGGLYFNDFVADASISYRYNTEQHITVTSFKKNYADGVYNIEMGFYSVELERDLELMPGDTSYVETVTDNWITVKFELKDSGDHGTSLFKTYATLVLGRTKIDELVDDQLYTFSGTLVSTRYTQLPPRLDSIRLYADNVAYGRDIDITKDGLGLGEGYNISLDLDSGAKFVPLPFEPTKRNSRSTTIKLNASPGLGVGKMIPDCSVSDSVKTINGASPDPKGNFNLITDSCLNVSPDDTVPALRLRHECEPCCDCVDYKAVYEAIRRRVVQGAAVDARLDQIRAKVEAVIDSIGTTDPAVRVNVKLFPRAGWVVGVQGIIYNGTGELLTGLSLVFEVMSDYEYVLVPGSGFLTSSNLKNVNQDIYRLGNEFTLNWEGLNIRAGTLVTYGFELLFPSTLNEERVPGTQVYVTMHTTINSLGTEISNITASAGLQGHINQ